MIEEISRASSVFFDTAPFIYYVEKDASFFPLVEPIFQAFDSGAKEAIASHLTLAEALTKPFELGRDDLALRYKKVLLTHSHVTIFPVDAGVKRGLDVFPPDRPGHLEVERIVFVLRESGGVAVAAEAAAKSCALRRSGAFG